jgi:hypothetical protein
MSPTVKVILSALISLLTTYTATAQLDGNAQGFSWSAGIAAVVAALNAVGNLFVKKPTNTQQ